MSESELPAALDRWQRAGRRLDLWLRDDDAVAETPALDRLLALAGRHRIALMVAAIPMKLEPTLAPRLAGHPVARVAVHGAWHRNHAAPGEKAREFPPARGLDTIRDELSAARAALVAAFGPEAGRCYVPPWNRIDPEVVALLPELGFSHVSAFAATPPAAMPGLATLHTHVDIIDWKGGRTGRPIPWLMAETARQITDLHERTLRDTVPPARSALPRLGLLAHHLAHDEAAWAGLDALLATLLAHPAVRPLAPAALFQA
jgi:hypothetical protein